MNTYAVDRRRGASGLITLLVLLAACTTDPGNSSGAPGINGSPAPTPPARDGAGGVVPMQPFDGGEYTWRSTGVTMRTFVLKIEPWGKRDDFCGNGSCGVADPDDTRFVLKYEIIVPPAYPGPFDPLHCPGSMHVASGNDDEAFGSVAGDNARGLSEDIFPGRTKFGVKEYYIEKAYVDGDFYVESTCGDPANAEIAYFGGKTRRG